MNCYCSNLALRLEFIELFCLHNLLCQKISTYLGRKRREMGIKKTTKGGRPTEDTNEKISDGRARRTTVGDTECE
jgi:hypothetical protein